jgi:hypothetical protein
MHVDSQLRPFIETSSFADRAYSAERSSLPPGTTRCHVNELQAALKPQLPATVSPATSQAAALTGAKNATPRDITNVQNTASNTNDHFNPHAKPTSPAPESSTPADPGAMSHANVKTPLTSTYPNRTWAQPAYIKAWWTSSHP